MNTTCLLCRRQDNRVVFREMEVDMLRCNHCGHVFSSYETDQHYDEFWGDKEVKEPNEFWWNDAHEGMYGGFCRQYMTGRGGKLLDVGCGLGYFVKRAAAMPGWDAYGYEISPHAVKFANTRLGLKNVRAGRVEESGFAPGFFDIITLWDVVEHIPDPQPMLRYLATLLKPEGLLFLHTPNIEFQLPKAKLKKMIRGMRPDLHYIEAKDHVNIFSPKTLTMLLERNGFSNLQFTHLKPVQSVSGSKSGLLKLAKNAWFYTAVALHRASLGSINVDNLFVAARKSAA